MSTYTMRLPNLLSWSRKIALCLISSLLCTVSVLAQSKNGTISGRVLDAETEHAMPSAEITIDGTPISATTDSGGYYTLLSIPAGDITLTAHYASYVSVSKKITVSAGENTQADFNLRLVKLDAPGAPKGSAADKKDDVLVMEKFTVSTERAGNAKVFMEQKNSMSMSTIAATDSFGETSEGNVADFLKFMPGVQIGYDDNAEASTIALNGMDPKYVGVMLDGANAASAAGGSFDDASRAFQFDQVSINSIESIEIIESPGADMPSDRPAGFVKLRSRSAFERKRAMFSYDLFFAVSTDDFRLGRSVSPGDTLSRKIKPGFKLSYTTPFLRNTMGLTVSLGRVQTFKSRAEITNNYANLQTERPFVKDVTYKINPQMAERDSASIRYDWKISPFAKLAVNINYGSSETDSANKQIKFAPGRLNTTSASVTEMKPNDKDATNSLDNYGGRSIRTGATYGGNFNFELKRGRIQLEALGSYSHSDSETSYGKNGFFSNVPIGIDKPGYINAVRPSGRSTEWEYSLVPIPEKPTEYKDWSQLYHYTIGDITDPLPRSGTLYTLAGDVNVTWTAPTRRRLQFKTGFNYAKEVRESVNALGFSKTYHYLGDPAYRPSSYVIDTYRARPEYSPTDIANYGIPEDYEYLSLRSPYVFDAHMGGNLADLGIPSVDREKLYRIFQAHPDWFYETVSSKLAELKRDLSGTQDLSETVMSGFFKVMMQPMTRLRFETGVRYEYTDQQAKTMIPYTRGQMRQWGWTPDYKDYPEYVMLQYKNGERTSISNSYAKLLPSASLKYTITPNLSADLGYYKSYSRGDVEKIAGNWSVNDDAGTATAPNPRLKPDMYDKYQAKISYIFEPAGKFTLSYGLQTWPGRMYEKIELEDSDQESFDRLYASYDATLIDGFRLAGYRIFTYIDNNAVARRVQSIKLEYSQNIPFIRGLNIYASFTRLVPTWRKTNTAPKTATVGISYSYRSFRINTNTSWLDRTWTTMTSDETRPYNNRARYAQFDTNIDLYFKISNKFQLYLSVQDLLNGNTAYNVNGDPNMMTRSMQPGTIVRAGVKGSF